MKAYRYGCQPPHVEVGRVLDQMRLAHRYRNALTEVELGRRALIPPRCPCAVGESGMGECSCAACGNAKAQEQPKLHCGKSDPAWAVARGFAIGHASEAAAEWRRRLRAASGLYWGTYLLVEEGADRQRGSRDTPRFRRFDWTGRVGVQIQKGISVAAAFAGEDSRLRLRPMPDPPGVTPGSRRSGQRVEVSLRVGSDGRAPIFAVVPALFHRPLPADGLVKWAVLKAERCGPVAVGADGYPRVADLRWSLIFSVEEADAPPDDCAPPRSGTVAVDLGWRVRSDGLRVGYWLDDAGEHGEFLLPAEVPAKLDHARSLGSIRDRNANEFQARLLAWKAGREQAEVPPEWFSRATATLAQWRSADRLARLAERWRDRRFLGDESIWPAVEAWRRQDRHLCQWEAHETVRALGRRLDLYRQWAADLARRYRAVVIEDFDLRQVAGRRGVAEDADDGEKVRADRASSRRHVAAPGTFRLALLNACRSRRSVVAKRPAAWTTRECECGAIVDGDPAATVRLVCECGRSWDQDWNACRNLLASGPVVAPAPSPLARAKSARSLRFAAAKAAKRNGAAVEAGRRSQQRSQATENVGDGA